MAASHANHLNTLTRKIYGISGMVTARVRVEIAERLVALGQELVNKAGIEGTYTNRLNNLRASIGSCLFVDGKEYLGPSQVAKEHNALLRQYEAHGWDTLAVEAEGYSRRYYNDSPAPTKPRKDPFREGKEVDGIDALTLFFNDYRDEKKCPKGKWQLVIAAAMFYGTAVEDKGYKVISNIAVDMESSQIAQTLKGTVKNLENRWGTR